MASRDIVVSTTNWEVQKRTLPAEKIAQIDQIAQNLALPDQTKGWLARLAPDKLQRLRKKSDVSLLDRELNVREEMFQMLCDARKEAAIEVYNEILVRGKAELRGTTAELFIAKAKEVSDFLSKQCLEFSKDLGKVIAEARKQKDLGLREKLMARTVSTRDRFFEGVEKSEAQFAKILDELRPTASQ
jgi:hypothetical protein